MRIDLSIILRLFLSLLLAFPFDVYATCSTDGFGSTSAALTISATTSSSSGVIVVGTFLENATGTSGTVTGVSGCGLTWSARHGNGNLPLAWTDTVSTSGINLDEYEAVYSSPLAACTITVATTGTVTAQRITYWAFTGINTGTPFDTNASLPAVNHIVHGVADIAAISVTGVSTTNASTCAFSWVRTLGSAGTFTPPSGWTTLGASGSTAMDFYYNIFASAQSSITVPWSWSTNNSSAGAVVDAVQSAGGGGSPTDTMMFMGLPR